MEKNLVLASSNGGVLTLTFNRPDRLNAWTLDLEERYFELLDEADASEDVRVIVVTGAGRGFCPGVDLEVLAERSRAPAQPAIRSRRNMTYALGVRKPMIAAVNGACAGVGLVQALCCDVRFAAAGANFATAFPRRGLCAEFGISWLLPRIVGHARALELLLSGRKFSADEAARIGMVHEVVPDDRLLETAHAYARDLAAHCSPLAMAAAKAQVHADWERSRFEAEQWALAFPKNPENRIDFQEGVASYRERRPPRFAPLPARRVVRKDR